MIDPVLELEVLGTLRKPNRKEQVMIDAILSGEEPVLQPLEDLEVLASIEASAEMLTLRQMIGNRIHCEIRG